MSGGMIGCPIAESVPRRIVIAVVAPGPLVSSGLLVSLSGADTGLGYAVEAAHPLDASQTQILPAACATTLQLVNATGLRLTTRSTLPPLFTDCDTNSAGQVLASTCPDDFHPVASFGFLYTKVVPCGYIPEIRTSAWTNTGVVPDADGDATVTVDPAPRPGECVLVGGTTMLDGVETASLTGYVQPDIDCVDSDGDGVSDCVDNCPTVPNFDQNPCACAQCPAVEGLTVDFSNPIGKGSGVVSWSTTREFDVVGFNIVTIDGKGTRTQLNPALIHCEECVTGAGHFYSYVIPKHKNGHNMFLEVLFLQGTVRLAGPAQKIH